MTNKQQCILLSHLLTDGYGGPSLPRIYNASTLTLQGLMDMRHGFRMGLDPDTQQPVVRAVFCSVQAVSSMVQGLSMCKAKDVNEGIGKLYVSIEAATPQLLVSGPSQEAADHVQPVQLASYLRHSSLTHEVKLHRKCPLFARKFDAGAMDQLVEWLQSHEMSVLITQQR